MNIPCRMTFERSKCSDGQTSGFCLPLPQVVRHPNERDFIKELASASH